MATDESVPSTNNKQRVSIDLRIIVAALFLVIVAMVFVWKPWATTRSQDRTISVTGETTVSGEPDEYVFSPEYEVTSADQDTALDQLTKKSELLVGELKKLGVKDSAIKTNANNYNYPVAQKSSDGIATYTLQLTITIDDKNIAQKAQNYLLTTNSTGTITPYPDFSQTKRKSLESQARNAATKDARSKAEQSAKNLGFSLGKVKSVTDGNGFGSIYPLSGGPEALDTSGANRKLAIQPGENDISYSVTVVYYVK